MKKMSELRRSNYSKKANIKIVRDEHGEMIKTAQGILCEQVDRDGNTTLNFLQTTSNASSSAVDNDQMPCNTATTTTQDNWSEGLGRLLAAYELAFSSSDRSDEEIEYIWLLKGRKKPQIKHYITNVVDQLSEEEFEAHFRLSRGTCEHIIYLFKRSEYYPKNLHGRKKKTPKEHILVFLWFAANKTTIRSVAERFDMQIATVHFVIKSCKLFN